jgi:hypothetical protein
MEKVEDPKVKAVLNKHLSKLPDDALESMVYDVHKK